MWETTKLSRSQIFDCDKYQTLFLPSKWCLDVFKQCGIRSNIELFDGFVSNVYKVTKFVKKDKLVIS